MSAQLSSCLRDQITQSEIAKLSTLSCVSLFRGLKKHGLWPPKDQYRAAKQERRRRGHLLLEELILPILGSEDATYIISDSAFGVDGFRLRSRLPTVLAFGYEAGALIHDNLLPTATRNRHEVASQCALLNLGVSLLDRLVDGCEEGVELFHWLDDSKVQRLSHDPRYACNRIADVAQIPHPTVRIVVKIAYEFYARLANWQRQELHADDWTKLTRLLIEAYRAEVACARAHPFDFNRLEDVAVKSIFPFLIMGQLARVSAAAAIVDRADDMSNDIGAVFALADDLVDLATDLEREDVNAVAMKAARDTFDGVSLPGAGDVTRRLFEGDYIASSVEELCQLMTKLMRRNPHNVLLTMYLRSWIPRSRLITRNESALRTS